MNCVQRSFVNMNGDREEKILSSAIKALREETGLVLRPAKSGRTHDQFGALLTFEDIAAVEYIAEVKAWAGHANFGALVAKLESLGARPLLVADYVNPNMATRLRDHDIEFIDTCGNAYLHVAGRLFVFSKGRKPPEGRSGRELLAGPVKAANAMGRALEPSGLRVVFAFLCDPSLAGKPYRDIAAAADVAVGTVGWVIRGLKEAGYLMDPGSKGKRQLVRREQLLGRWVENYPLKLRPKLHLGDFSAATSEWWKHFNAAEYQCHWGGEIAAAKLTGNLQPEVASIYLPESHFKSVVMSARLRKYNEAARDGMKVQLYRQFWSSSVLSSGYQAGDLVPPLLVYADLVASGDPRNLENARSIYEDWLIGPERED